MIRFIFAILLVLPVVAPRAADRLAGPVPAEVLRVLDGDTVEVEARIWLGQTVRTLVRLRGADAPELHGRCARERDLAAKARAFVTGRANGAVTLRDIARDKYGGRVTARVLDAKGQDITAALLRAGLARPYGGRAKSSWCAAG